MLDGGLVAGQATGQVDQDVDPAVLQHDPIDGLAHFGLVGKIGRHRQHARPACRQLLRSGFDVIARAGHDSKGRALRCQRPGDRLSDLLVAAHARHQRDFAR